jgi:hypothetical protein
MVDDERVSARLADRPQRRDVTEVVARIRDDLGFPLG